MCDPVTASIVLAVGAAGLSAASAYQMNKNQEAIANYNADTERDTGYQNELAFRDEARRNIAAQTARLSASGVALDSGTPLLLLSDSAKNSELDAITIRRNAAAKSGAYRFQASVYNRAAPLSAAAALFSSASSAALASGFGTPSGPGSGGGLSELGNVGANTGGFEYAYG